MTRMMMWSAVVLLLATSSMVRAQEPPTGRACPVPIFAFEKGAKGFVPDTTWYGFGDGITGARATRGKDAWVVDYTWFRMSTSLDRIWSYAQMESLETVGLVDSSVSVGTVNWRTVLHAASAKEARERAALRRPAAAPEDLWRAVRRNVTVKKASG